MSRRWRAALLAGAVLVLALAAAPAYAQDEVGVSADGTTWADDLATPLFDPATRWVPGDSRTATFYVRNRAAGPGTLAVAFTARDLGGLVRHDDVALEARVAGGAWTALPADAEPHVLTGGRLAAAASTRIEVRAAFDPASPNRSQLRRLDLAFQVVLTGTGEEVSPPGGGGHGLLPDTGGVAARIPLIGLLLVGLGTWLVLARRRKDDDVHQT